MRPAPVDLAACGSEDLRNSDQVSICLLQHETLTPAAQVLKLGKDSDNYAVGAGVVWLSISWYRLSVLMGYCVFSCTAHARNIAVMTRIGSLVWSG